MKRMVKSLLVVMLGLMCLTGMSQVTEKKNVPLVDTIIGSVNTSYYWYGDVTYSLSKGLIVGDVLRLKIVDGDTLNAVIKQVAFPIDSVTATTLTKVYDRQVVSNIKIKMSEAIRSDQKELKPLNKK